MKSEANNSSKIKAWILAARPRTLPLALSSIFMGAGLAAFQNQFRLDIFLLACLTTILLQILSNLANDYGDSVHGADHDSRTGPKRAVQAGLISSIEMLKGIKLLAALSFISGIVLLLVAFSNNWEYLALYVGFGVFAILAAILYTNGKRPYGYMGLGDISVFIFFGILGVAGSNFLFTQHFEISALLPACINGFLATGVLNINNIRDIDSDKQAGKNSIPVRIGMKNAKVYHLFLLLSAMLCSFSYFYLQFNATLGYMPLIYPVSAALILLPHTIAVIRYDGSQKIDGQLKILALSTLAFTIVFIAGLMLF